MSEQQPNCFYDLGSADKPAYTTRGEFLDYISGGPDIAIERYNQVSYWFSGGENSPNLAQVINCAVQIIAAIKEIYPDIVNMSAQQEQVYLDSLPPNLRGMYS